jgi:hypothetical protein
MSVETTQTATPASATSASAAAPAAVRQSLGTVIDSEIVLLKSRLATLEAAGKTDWAAFKARVAKDWPHVVTWLSLAASSPLVTDFVKKLI